MRLFLLALAIACLAQPAGAQAPEPLKALTYEELGKVVRSHRGKPVVVYFWSFG